MISGDKGLRDEIAGGTAVDHDDCAAPVDEGSELQEGMRVGKWSWLYHDTACVLTRRRSWCGDRESDRADGSVISDRLNAARRYLSAYLRAAPFNGHCRLRWPC